MFEIETSASVAKVTVSAKTKDGITLRRVRMRLDREFDDAIAAQLGGEAKRALAGLASGGISKVTLPIDAVIASIDLVAFEGDKATIPRAAGIKAVGNAPTDEDSPPSIQLEFEFLFSDEAWIWLGRNVGGMATISIASVQLELAKAS